MGNTNAETQLVTFAILGEALERREKFISEAEAGFEKISRLYLTKRAPNEEFDHYEIKTGGGHNVLVVHTKSGKILYPSMETVEEIVLEDQGLTKEELQEGVDKYRKEFHL